MKLRELPRIVIGTCALAPWVLGAVIVVVGVQMIRYSCRAGERVSRALRRAGL